MLKIFYEGKFINDLNRMKKRGVKLHKLHTIISILTENKILDSKHRTHKLKGKYQSYYECHIEPDWLLIYKKTSLAVILIRTGTHSDLF